MSTTAMQLRPTQPLPDPTAPLLPPQLLFPAANHPFLPSGGPR